MTLARSNPLQALIQRAASAPVTASPVAHIQRRIDSAGHGQVVLADVSDSMGEAVGERTKFDILRDALAGAMPPGGHLVAFSSSPAEIRSVDALPQPSGGTALHLALDLAATMRPARTLVISDGEPDSETFALASADRLPGVIDVIYCGPADNYRARDFLMRLARAGGGAYVATDLRRAHAELGPSIRGLLAP